MLSQLTIHNFGLIDKLTVEPSKGLNIFTGETGAGKSILIDALRYALGEKLNTSQVRDTDKPCVVEAVFELSPEQIASVPLLAEHVQEEDPVLIIHRAYTTDGRNKNRINDFSVTVSRLREIGNHLVDLHGPHDHQMLLSEDSHIGILDRLSGIEKDKDAYAEKYAAYLDLQKKLRELRDMAETRERELDMLAHQIKEMEQVPLDREKYEELLSSGSKIDNAEKLHECVNALIDILDNDETGINSEISRAFSQMNTLNSTDESTGGLASLLENIQENSVELSSALASYLDRLSFEPGEAEDINRRLDIYTELLRKYGPEMEDVRLFYTEAKEKHGLLVDIEHNTGELQARIDDARKEADKTASALSSKRKKTAKTLEKTIEKELGELGISKVRFECRVEKTELTRDGHDKVVFYISPNIGEDLKPLAEIVSSGEAARVMLALKKALTGVDLIPVLIFDEIDAQIGGRLGAITGKKLKELSGDRQVLLITHLPQIASFGDIHMKVCKKVRGERTLTEVHVLDKDSRVKELAQMMSGDTETEIAVKHAHDMLSRAGK